MGSDSGNASDSQVYLLMLENGLASQTGKKARLPLGKERILLVDDEWLVAEVVSRLLERLGYRVTAMTSGFEALEVFHRRPREFDLVITDLTMPQITGFELAADVLKVRPDLPIILCSGYDESLITEIARESGIRECLMKPASLAHFARVIRRVLDANRK